MAIMMTDVDVESGDSALHGLVAPPVPDAIVEWCSVMTGRLGLLAGIVPHDLPEPVPFTPPPVLAG